MEQSAEGKKNPAIKPLSDNIVIRPLTEDEAGTTSASGIIVPETVSDKDDGKRGVVVAVGPGKWNEDGDKRIAVDVEVGNMVIFQSWKDKVKIDGDEYWVVPQSDVQAIIQ